jgi:WD40 repeat protein
MSQFELKSECIVIVPGNHDVSWGESEKAYSPMRREEFISKHGEPNEDNAFFDKQSAYIEALNKEYHKERFAYFREFYQSVKGSEYSLEYDLQYELTHFPKHNLLILGLNSSWNIDNFYTSRASINQQALNNALKIINNNPLYKNCIKVAVWHHPIISPDEARIKDHSFLERLINQKFHIALHGHIHKTGNNFFRAPHTLGGHTLNIISGGTFGSDSRHWSAGYPQQYNLLNFEGNRLTVETRRRESLEGIWSPDARWESGYGEDPKPRYYIDLSVSVSGEQNKQLSFNKTEEIQQKSRKRPDVGDFFGRSEELVTLTEAITNYNLISLTGMAGIGKTSLGLKLAEKVENNCGFSIIWQSLHSINSVEEVITTLIQQLPNQVGTESSKGLGESISRLIDYISQNRCLIVLDATETILVGGGQKSHYRESFAGFGKLLKQLLSLTQKLKGCLLLIGRDMPCEVMSAQERKHQLFHSQPPLLGLFGEDGRKIITQIHPYFYPLEGDNEVWNTLIHHYGGNPEALKLVASQIKENNDGDISSYVESRIKQNSAEISVPDAIRKLFKSPFDRLHFAEKEVLYWLAVEFEPVTLLRLREDVVTFESKVSLINQLIGLESRGFVESFVRDDESARWFRLAGAFRTFIIERLIEQVVSEIESKKVEEIKIFNSHALVKAQADDYVRDIQTNLILAPIKHKLLIKYGSSKLLKDHLMQFISSLQNPQNSFKAPGYLASNIINLLGYLDSDLSGLNFSNLHIQQASLQNRTLHSTNFANSFISESTFKETFSSINTITFSADGNFFAFGESNGNIRLCRTSDGKEIRRLDKKHHNQVWSIAFSPTSSILASAGEDNSVRRWNIDTGEHKKLEGHTKPVRSVTFSPNGEFLVSGGDDHFVVLWDIATGEYLQKLDVNTQILSVAFSFDAKTIALGGEDGVVYLWDYKTKNSSDVPPKDSKPIYSVAFSCDQEILAFGSENGLIHLWNVKTKTYRSSLQSPAKKRVRAVAFSSNSKILASGSADGVIRLWNVETEQCELMLEQAHKKQIRAIAFSPDGKTLVSGGDDSAIKIWDVKTKRCRRTLQGYPNRFWSLDFSPDGKTLVSGGEDQNIHLWDIETEIYKKLPQNHIDWVWSVVFSPNGKLIASSSEDGMISLWNVFSKQHDKNLSEGATNHRVRSVAFSPDGSIVASTSDDCNVYLRNVDTGDCKTLKRHSLRVLSVAFSPDGQSLASSSKDKTIILWDIIKGKHLRTLFEHSDQVHSIAFSPDGKTLASASFDRTLKLWDVSTGKCLETLSEHTDQLLCVTYSRDGKLLASSGHDRTVRIWDANTGECVRVLTEHEEAVEAVRFNPDSSLIASCSQDATIRIWDVKTGDHKKLLRVSRPYEGMNISGVTGLSDAEKALLLSLGAEAT